MTGAFRQWSGETASRRRYHRQRREVERQVDVIKGVQNQLQNEYNDYSTKVRGFESHLGDIQNKKQYLSDLLGRSQEYSNDTYKLLRDTEKKFATQATNLNSLYTGLQSDTAKYQSDLDVHASRTASFARDVNELTEKKNRLASAVFAFQNQAPELASMIETYQNLPNEVNALKASVEERKNQLTGLTTEEAGERMAEFNQMFSNLKQKKADTEAQIRNSLVSITARHGNMQGQRSELLKDMREYDKSASKVKDVEHLLNVDATRLRSIPELLRGKESSLEKQRQSYEREREHFETSVIPEINRQKQRFADEFSKGRIALNSDIEATKRMSGEIETVKNNALNTQNYIRNLESNLEGAGATLGDLASTYRTRANRTGLYQGLALSALGAVTGAGLAGLGGGSIGTGALIGGGIGASIGALHMATRGGPNINPSASFAGREQTNFGTDFANAIKSRGLDTSTAYSPIYALSNKYTPISFGTLGNTPKMNIPELGGMPLSLEHFSLPTLPTLTQLPTLESALGRVTSAEDISSLRLGLPTNASRQGHGFTNSLNPDFFKLMKKATKTLSGSRRNKASSFGALTRAQAV